MTIHSLKRVVLMAALVVTPMSESLAQRGDRQGDRQGGGRQNREQLERRFRQNLANLLKTQLGLTDEGLRQVSEVNQRFDQQRRELNRRDMLTRRALRDEVLKRDSANAGRIEQLLTDHFRIERERLDLTEAEQRELGKFLTPVQRARYIGVQEQIRRQMDDMRGRRMPGLGDPPSGSPRGRKPPAS